MPPLLEVTDVSKWFGGAHALDTVDFGVEPGTVHALLGGNGSGKSTLIKTIAGLQPADHGTITIADRSLPLSDWTASMAYASNLRFVHQNPGLLTHASVAENICMGRGWSRVGPQIRWKRVHERARAALETLEIDIDPRMEISDLPYGKRTLVAVARALADLDPARGRGVLVLDEPTATLPHNEMVKVLDLIRRVARSGNGVVYVSHRIEEILSVADEVTVLRDGKNVGRRQRDTLDRNHLIDLIVGPGSSTPPAPPAASGHRDPATVLAANGLSAGPVRDLTITLTSGEILGVVGQSDAGGEDLVKAIYGVAPRSGDVLVNGEPLPPADPRASMRRGLVYVPSDRLRDAVFSNMSISENLMVDAYSRYFRGGRIRDRRLRQDTAAELGRLDVRHGSIDASIRTLSGGNQQKVVIARMLGRHPKVLLLNDPTQGVDVGARRDIWRLIREYLARTRACAVVYSTDYEEVIDVADRVLVLYRTADPMVVDTASLDRQALAGLTYRTATRSDSAS